MAKVVPITETNASERLSDWDWFWSEYPRKKNKGDAWKAWNQVEKLRPPIEELIAAIETQCRSSQWQTKEYIPYPGTWLRAWGWADED